MVLVIDKLYHKYVINLIKKKNSTGKLHLTTKLNSILCQCYMYIQIYILKNNMLNLFAYPK